MGHFSIFPNCESQHDRTLYLVLESVLRIFRNVQRVGFPSATSKSVLGTSANRVIEGDVSCAAASWRNRPSVDSNPRVAIREELVLIFLAEALGAGHRHEGVVLLPAFQVALQAENQLVDVCFAHKNATSRWWFGARAAALRA